MPKISIITINLNNLKGLKRTMESVFEQTFTDYEYIIIDGCSTDGSKELIEKNQNRFSYWISETDKGIYNAMNKGILRATGAYLLFLNSGDYFYSKRVLMRMIENSNNEDIIYGNLMIDRGERDKNEVKLYPQLLTFKYFFKGTLPHSSSLIKKELFTEVGLYNEENKVVSDWEFFLKAICLFQASYQYVNLIVSCFHPDGISSKRESVQIILNEKQMILNKAFGAFLPDYQSAEKQKQIAVELSNSLNLYKNSRMHRFIEKVITLPVYKFFKSYTD